MDNQSITHTRWNCTYHIVFISKYRRKIVTVQTPLNKNMVNTPVIE